MLIDSHHHLWNYDPDQYAWIDDPQLRRDFGVDDLQTLASENAIDRFVTVQARESIEETDWLLGLSEQTDLIAGVVGWLPLADRDFETHLRRVADHPKLVSLRHVIQGLPTTELWLGEAFGKGLTGAAEAGLAYDLLIYGNQLGDALTLVDRHPNLRMVVDHIAKPAIAGDAGQGNSSKPGPIDRQWRDDFKKLAERENVWCKWSGAATEVRTPAGGDPPSRDQWWNRDTMRPYFEVAIESFGVDRLMFGSDWPVCLSATTYDRWIDVTRHLTESLSDQERNKFWGGNAATFYQIET